MMKIAVVNLPLQHVDQLLTGPGSLFYGKRMLKPEAEELIIEEAAGLSAGDRIRIRILVPESEWDRAGEIRPAIHRHFLYRKEKSARQLRSALMLGWKSLLIATLFLAMLVYGLSSALPEDNLSLTFRELMIILGWVALWRPADLLLYEWRPVKREVNLFRRLENCEVEVVPLPGK